MSWVQPYHAQCARQWLSATATAMHVARPRSRPSHATQRPFRTHYRTYPGAARGVDITSRQHVDQRLRMPRSKPATRGKWGKSNACAWSTQHAHQKQHPCTVRHHPDAHIAHGYGLAHAPVSARAKMIDLLPHLDSLVGRCSAVQGTSRKGGRARFFAPALMMLFMISSATSSASSTSSIVLTVSSCLPTASLLFLKPCHVFVSLPLTQCTNALHSAVESADAHRIVQCVGTYHEPRPQKSRAALALQRQERPNSRTELGPQSGTFTLYLFTLYGLRQVD